MFAPRWLVPTWGALQAHTRRVVVSAAIHTVRPLLSVSAPPPTAGKYIPRPPSNKNGAGKVPGKPALVAKLRDVTDPHVVLEQLKAPGAMSVPDVLACITRLARMTAAGSEEHQRRWRSDPLVRSAFVSLERRMPEMTERSLATLASLAATYKIRDNLLFDTIAKQAMQTSFTQPSSISNIARVFAQRSRQQELFEHLADAVVTHTAVFSPKDAMFTLLAFAQKKHTTPRTERMGQALARHVLQQVGTMPPREISTIVYALAELGVQHSALLGAVAVTVEKNIADFNDMDLVMVLTAMTNLNAFDKPLFDTAALQLERRAPNMAASSMSYAAWCYATLRYPAPSLFATIARHFMRNSSVFDRATQIKLLWCFAELGVPAPEVFSEAARLLGSPSGLAGADGRDLATLLWAYAKTNHHAPELFAHIQRRVAASRESLEPRSISMLAHACAQLNLYTPELFQVLTKSANDQIRYFNARDLSSWAWALSKLRIANKETCRKIADATFKRLDTFSLIDISQLAGSLSSANYHDKDLFNALEMSIVSRELRLTPIATANILWAYTNMGIPLQRKDRLKAYITRNLSEFKPWMTIMSLWSLAVGKDYDSTVWAPMLESLQAIDPAEFATTELNQLHQICLAIKTEAPLLTDAISARTRDAARASWKLTTAETTSSQIHKDISETLSWMGVPHTNEYVDPESLLSIDIALVAARLAIEVDGSKHFAINDPGIVLGPTLFKQRLLRATGWQFEVVTPKEWDRACGAHEPLPDKIALLASKLRLNG